MMKHKWFTSTQDGQMKSLKQGYENAATNPVSWNWKTMTVVNMHTWGIGNELDSAHPKNSCKILINHLQNPFLELKTNTEIKLPTPLLTWKTKTVPNFVWCVVWLVTHSYAVNTPTPLEYHIQSF